MAAVAADSAVEFDLGPLSWVQGEIDQALAEGIDALAAYEAAPDNPSALKHARNHVHQAAGAIRMVGLDAVVAYTDEIERQLARLEELAGEGVPGGCAVVDRACRKLRIFLGEVVNGAPPVPLILFPEYEGMQRERGIKAAVPTDLFYPDLAARVQIPGAAATIPPDAMPAHLVRQRRTYQHGLLALLRGDLDGARAMRSAAAGIAAAMSQPNLRAFWWTVGAMFDALAAGGLDAEFAVKQLAGRIDLQIRRVLAGSTKVADRLRREVLYFIAISAPVAPTVLAVQEAYRLTGLIPSDELLNADVVRLQPLLREAREHLASAKDTWLKVASGRAENLPKLNETLASVHAIAVEIGNGSLVRLTASLAARLDGISPTGNVPELFAMEYATGMLLAESAVENYAGLSSEFPMQVDAMLARLDAAQAARQVPDGAAPLLDEMSKRAQERVLVAQVGREIQANLRHMEQVLDAFFRDHAKRGELATLARDSQQIRGALRMLDLDDAERLLGLCQEQIESYADPDTIVEDVDLELLAESLSGLGFYVEAVEQQRPGRERLIAPLLAARLGEAPKAETIAGETVEAAVEELRTTLPALVARLQRSPADDTAAREALRTRLGDLVDDAKLIDDARLIAQAQDALRELDGGGAAALEAAVTAIAGAAAAPAPAISDETQRLLASEASGLDAELVEIYLAEAAEVLDTIAAQHALLQDNFGDREALRTVRRQFHTLKGSGRMVGLTELGELAYDVEKIHNRLLEEERPVTRTVLAMIGIAERDFRRWVAALKATGHVHADSAQLHAAIREVESELPGDRESVLEPAPGFGAAAPRKSAAAGAPGQPSVAPVVLPELGTETAAGAPMVETSEIGEAGMLEVIEVGATAAPGPGAMAARAPTAGGSTEEAIAASETAARPKPDEIVIGDVTVSAALYTILVDETDGYLATLAHEMSRLEGDPRHEPSPAMVRASHTMCGIYRTGGFPLIATTAKALEQCLLGLPQLPLAMREPALPLLARAVGCVAQLVGRVRAGTGFTPEDAAEAGDVGRRLDTLRQQMAMAPAHVDAETMAEREAEASEREESQAGLADFDIAQPMLPAPFVSVAREAMAAGLPPVREEAWPEATAEAPDHAGAQTPRPVAGEVPEEVHDEIDDQVLPIFLEEAAELFPQAGEELRAWRRAPGDAGSAMQLRRTLHTFKGSARMAGALRLGELVHLMESRFVAGDTLVAGTAELFEALDTDLDHIAFVLDALRAGRTDVALPWSAAQRMGGEAPSAATRQPSESANPEICPEPESATPSWTFDEPTYVATPIVPIDEPTFVATPIVPIDEPPPSGGSWMPDEIPAVGAAPSLPAEASSPVPAPMPIEVSTAAEPRLPPELPAPTEGPLLSEIPELPEPAAGRPVVVPLMTPAMAAAPHDSMRGPQEIEPGTRAMLRVRADIVDRIANEAGEVAIARARIEGEMRSLKVNLLELTGSVIRLRAQMREIEIQAESQIQSRMSQVGEAAEGFDPLELDRYTHFQELARSLAEGINDVSTVQQALLKNLDDAEAALIVQGRLSRDIQQQLFAIRTVPFGSVAERLYRILRATAKELDKRVNLDIRGGQTELDRSVLEKLVGPLEHLLRNAVDHGIEPREARARAGKPRVGEITLTVRQVANEIAIELADDGAGLDFEEIRARAIALGKFAADARPSEAQLVECIFEPGFSTASRLTRVSGRGIGMDVARAEIAALGGRIEVSAKPRHGTTFTLYLPLTLAVAQAVLVRVAGRTWALPAPMVEQVLQVKAEGLAALYAAGRVEWQGSHYPFHYLPRLLGDARSSPEMLRHNPVLLLRAGSNLAAVHVDEMVGNHEVVVKNIGPQLARVSGISGATVLGTGEIVLIINAVQLAQRADVPGFDESAMRVDRGAGEHGACPARKRPLVMIVDDSLTVRKITSRLLLREGFRVIAAKDGVDALEALESETPDAILLDIEMPRMDGFEFAKAIRREPGTAGIPIVMITSRIAEKHRRRAAELGVDAYLGKPYQEADLLRHLNELVAVPA